MCHNSNIFRIDSFDYFLDESGGLQNIHGQSNMSLKKLSLFWSIKSFFM